MELKGSVAVVTGAGSEEGIGRSTAIALARAGAAGVVVNYSRNQRAADEVVAAVGSAGGEAIAYRADVAHEDEVRSMMESTVERFG